MPLTRRASRDAALVELQRLHAAILASRARRGVGPAAAAAASVPAATMPSPEVRAAQELTRRLQVDATSDGDASPAPEPRSRRGWWLAMAAAAVVGGAWIAMTLSQRPEVVTEAAPPRTAPPAPAPATTPSPATPPAIGAISAATPRPTVAAPAAPARPIQVTLATIRPVWLRVTVDGARALQREVAAGETLSFGGERAVVIRSGDAGGVHATVNGADRGPLGLRGWPLTVSITPAGIEPLTPTRPEP